MGDQIKNGKKRDIYMYSHGTHREEACVDIISIQNKHYAVFCEDCQSEESFKVCKHSGCDNKDTRDICLNHQCYVCLKYQHEGEYYTCDSDPDAFTPDLQHHEYFRELKQCDICHKSYCVTKEGGCCYRNYDSKCGSVETNECNKCYAEKEENSLMTAIYENTPFYDNIAVILYEYAKGPWFECGNFMHCQKMISSETMLWFERQLDERRIQRPERSKIYGYHVSNSEIIEKYKNYLANINGKYWRLICKECANGNVLKRCESDYCHNHDVGTGFLPSGWAQVAQHVCLNHAMDIVEECDVCHAQQPLINFKIDEWLKNETNCEKCKNKVCKSCAKNGKHRRLCEQIQGREYMDWLNEENEANLGYRYYDFVINDNECGDNNSKKSLRKRMKNKRKCKKSLKQQRDKKGNAKYYKRSNQHKLFSNMLKNEM